MDWNNLLSDKRLGNSIDIPYNEAQYSMSAFEKDYWRIIDCPAFRRLQDKTQVFPLDKSDFVRTRLTHSLEVSALAKQLVAMIYKNINNYASISVKKAYPFTAEQAHHAAEIAACAGLLHDIGNPPFGHFGEVVVHAWFENHLNELTYYDNDAKMRISLKQAAIIADLKHFEGNAQAFRLLTKLHSVDSEYGLNLTAAVLNTLVKYPTDSQHVNQKAANICLHKLGYYYADQDLFNAVAVSTGTYFDNVYHRHPLTFILEAADDIAYATADLEDSYKKGLFTIDEFKTFFLANLGNISDSIQRQYSNELIQQLEKYRIPKTEDRSLEFQAFQKWINYTRHWLLYCAAYGFTHNYKDIMKGNFYSEIISHTNHEGTMAILKNAMVRFTYYSAKIIKLELSAEEIIESLLERFIPAAINWEVSSADRTTKKKSDEKLMTLVSENHKAAYNKYKQTGDYEYNLYLRLLLIADFISGMTDTFAKTLYQELTGV